MRPAPRVAALPWIAAALVAMAAIWTITPDPIGVFFDDAIYLATARAIAEGQGVVLSFLPGAPPAIHFPPGYPLLLAAVWWCWPDFPANIAILKFINPLLLAIAAAQCVRWITTTHTLSPYIATVLVVLSAASVPLMMLTGILLSEPLFVVLVVTAFLALARERGLHGALVIGLLAGAATLVRTLGIVLVLAVVLTWTAERRWRDLLAFVVTVATLLLPWQWYVWQGRGVIAPELGGMYQSYLQFALSADDGGAHVQVPAVISRNLGEAWTMVGVLLAPWTSGVLRQSIVATAVVAVAVGIGSLVGRTATRVAGLTLVGYLVTVLAWPAGITRFLWGIWPLLVLSGAIGTAAVWRSLRVSRWSAVAPLAIVAAIVILVGFTTYTVRGYREGWAQVASGQNAAWLRPLLQTAVEHPSLRDRRLATDAAPAVGLYRDGYAIPLARYLPSEFLEPRTDQSIRTDVEAVDRRFSPDAYLVLRGSVLERAILSAQLAPGRQLREISPGVGPVRSFLVDPP